VSERLPDRGTVVFVCWPPKQSVAVAKWTGKKWMDRDGYMNRDESFIKPVYWMPLPAPPKESP